MSGIRRHTGIEFDHTCVTVSIGADIIPVVSISYADARDGLLVVRPSVARARGLLRHDLPTVAVVTYSHPDIGSDSDMLQGFRVLGAETAIGAPENSELGSTFDTFAPASGIVARITDTARAILGATATPRRSPALTISLRIGYDRILWTSKRRCLHNPAKPRPEPHDPRKTIVDIRAVGASSVTEEQVREIMLKAFDEEHAQ